jgi:transcriptional regulator with XRE-family HTH domain
MATPRETWVPNQRLRQLRKERGWTQEDLVNELKAAGWDTCGVRSIQRYESGEGTTLFYKAHVALERVFGMPIEQLGFGTTIAIPKKFYIFDRANDKDNRFLSFRTRACWEWCDKVRVVCLDEFVAYDDASRGPFPEILTKALNACRKTSASLLVNRLDRIGDTDAVRKVLDHLGDDLQLWTLRPQTRRVTVAMLPPIESTEDAPVTADEDMKPFTRESFDADTAPCGQGGAS